MSPQQRAARAKGTRSASLASIARSHLTAVVRTAQFSQSHLPSSTTPRSPLHEVHPMGFPTTSAVPKLRIQLVFSPQQATGEKSTGKTAAPTSTARLRSLRRDFVQQFGFRDMTLSLLCEAKAGTKGRIPEAVLEHYSGEFKIPHKHDTPHRYRQC